MKLTIAVGQSRLDKKYKNEDITWDNFCLKVRKTHRTAESMADYLTLSKERQDSIKDIGGFVGGHLTGGRKLATAVSTRQLITLDLDEAKKDFWDVFTMQYACAALTYSTHKHTPENPRLRVVIPLNREVVIEEYEAICRRIASDTGMEQYDHTGFQASRLMYWPSTTKDGEYYYKEQDGIFLDADIVLDTYSDWSDLSQWPLSSKEKKLIVKTSKQQGNPTQKGGLIGAFCKAYTIQDTINEFLPDVYKESSIPSRYTYCEATTACGAIVYDDMFLFSHHSTDPCSGILVNAFDLLRIHTYGYLDTDADLISTAQPSFKECVKFLTTDIRTKKIIGQIRLENAKDIFKLKEEVELENEIDPLAWVTALSIDSRGKYLNTLSNINLILKHDDKFKNNLYYDSFSMRGFFKYSLDWRPIDKTSHYEKYITDQDMHNIESYIEFTYGLSLGNGRLEKAISIHLQNNKVHPIKDRISAVKWDNEPRINRLLIDYFGVLPTRYSEEVIRKSMIGAVARLYSPGCKFDNVLTLVGGEGQGKSQFFKRLGYDEWFNDSFTMTMLQSKEAFEQVQGSWIIEIPELAGMHKQDNDRIKAFLSSSKDKFRPSYGRLAIISPRQCVFFASTNEHGFLKSQNGNRRFWPVTTYTYKPEKKVFDMTDELVDQYWAEALVYYRRGEQLHLTEEVLNQALYEQAKYVEEDPIAIAILDFIAKPIPINYYNLLPYEKTDYYSNFNTERKDVIRRDTICMHDIFTHVMNRKIETYDKLNAKLIRNAMTKIPGWLIVPEVKSFGKYFPAQGNSYRRILTKEQEYAHLL